MLIGPAFGRIFEGKVRRRKNITGNIRYQPARDKARYVCGYSPEVMVRITSYGKEPGNALANLGYTSRVDCFKKDDLGLETDRGEILSGKAEIKEYAKGWERDFGRPNKVRRDTMRMILSMPAGTRPEAVKNATRQFASKTFAANHEYVFVLHTDEPHPHCHLTVKMRGRDGTRLDPNRDDLAHWREVFAEELRKEGMAAVATRRAARGAVRKSENPIERQIRENPRKGKQRVPKAAVLRELDAINEIKAELRGEQLAPGPWVEKIEAEQADVRSAWLAIAQSLEQPSRELVFLPDGHHLRLQGARVQAARYQAKLSEKRVVDPRTAPAITSLKTTGSIPTLAQGRVISTGRSAAVAPLVPIVLLAEDHHGQIEHFQRHGAVYQARLAAPRAGEPPRPIADMATLPRLESSRYGARLQWRRPLAVASLAGIPTLAAVNTRPAGAVAFRPLSPLVFRQESDHEQPSPSQYAGAVYQSNLEPPRVPPARSVPSVRNLPRVDVVCRATRRRTSAQMLLQQNARDLLGFVTGADPSLRRPGAGLDGDRAGAGRQSGAGGREGGTQGRAGGRESGAPGRTRRGEAEQSGRPESAAEAGRWFDTRVAGKLDYRCVGTVASILKLSDVGTSRADDLALARDIRTFVAGMPALETARDVLKRELAARYPAKIVPTQGTAKGGAAPESGKEQEHGQEKGADRAAPDGMGYGP